MCTHLLNNEECALYNSDNVIDDIRKLFHCKKCPNVCQSNKQILNCIKDHFCDHDCPLIIREILAGKKVIYVRLDSKGFYGIYIKHQWTRPQRLVGENFSDWNEANQKAYELSMGMSYDNYCYISAFL